MSLLRERNRSVTSQFPKAFQHHEVIIIVVYVSYLPFNSLRPSDAYIRQ